MLNTSEYKNVKPNKNITISRGLTELKLLDKRINKAVNDGLFVSAYKGNENTLIHRISKEDASAKIKSSVQSIKDLIKHRADLKSAIVTSNANTKVVISEVEYTVAEAIERKNSIAYEQMFLDGLKNNLAEVLMNIENNNVQMQNSLNMLLNQVAGSENKELAINTITKEYKESNEMKLYDPMKVEELIKNLENEINDFQLDVDVTLSESNAITFIEV